MQTFTYVGETPFTGVAPVGEYPSPIADWIPELDPTREYCIGVSAFGDGDRARLRLDSELVCTTVAQLSAKGAPPAPGTGAGCAVAGDGRSSSPAGMIMVAFFLMVLRRPRVRRT